MKPNSSLPIEFADSYISCQITYPLKPRIDTRYCCRNDDKIVSDQAHPSPSAIQRYSG